MMLIDTTTFITLTVVAVLIFAVTVTTIICCNELRSKREADVRTDKALVDLGEARLRLESQGRIIDCIYRNGGNESYGMHLRKDLNAYVVFRNVRLEYDWAYRCVPVKTFVYNPKDEEDKDFARREAEELLEKLREN